MQQQPESCFTGAFLGRTCAVMSFVLLAAAIFQLPCEACPNLADLSLHFMSWQLQVSISSGASLAA